MTAHICSRTFFGAAEILSVRAPSPDSPDLSVKWLARVARLNGVVCQDSFMLVASQDARFESGVVIDPRPHTMSD